jgi:chitin deacetylase
MTQLAFDDGPTQSSPQLYDFLAQNHLSDKATHFMIGGNILGK